MSNEDKKAIESAIAKLMYQKENFGFMERFTVDENWVALQALFAYQDMEKHDAKVRADERATIINLMPKCFDDVSYDYICDEEKHICSECVFEHLKKIMKYLKEQNNE